MTFYAINRPDNVQDAKDTALISFNTQLLNLPSSYNGHRPTPKADVQFGVHTDTKSVELLVREPNLDNTITFSTYNGDAMDVFQVSSSVKHTTASTSAAYNLTVTIPLPWNVHIVEQSLVFYSNTSYSPSQNPTNTTADVQYVSGLLATERNVTIFIPFLGMGSTFSFSFSLLMDNHTKVDESIVLTATVGYFSIWPIHSQTEAHPYTTTDSKTLKIDTPSHVNQIASTSLPETIDTSVSNGNINVGEQVVYRITLTLRVCLFFFPLSSSSLLLSLVSFPFGSLRNLILLLFRKETFSLSALLSSCP